MVQRVPDRVSRGAVRSATSGNGPAATVVSTGACKASFYAEVQGAASGERFDPDDLTAAHKTLKFDTGVRVNTTNGKSVDASTTAARTSPGAASTCPAPRSHRSRTSPAASPQ